MEPAAPPPSPAGPSPFDFLADQPTWLVVLVAGLALALVCWLLAKTFRVLATVVAVVVVVGACVLAWQHVFG